jgi:cellulose synthase/poly-beta-1,6-N-acetylglucosamine synthase-like glycosyltransferase
MTILTIIYYVLAGIGALILLLIFLVLTNKARLDAKKRQFETVKKRLENRYVHHTPEPLRGKERLLLSAYTDLVEGLALDEEAKVRAYEDFDRLGIISRLKSRICHPSRLVRKTAIFHLGHFPMVRIRFFLIDAFRKEKKADVKLYFAHALKRQMDQLTIHELIESVVKSRRFYQSRIIEILKTQIHECACYLGSLNERSEIEIKELFIEVALSTQSEDFRGTLLSEIKAVETHYDKAPNPVFAAMPKTRLKRYYLRLIQVLSTVYGWDLTTDYYRLHKEPEVVLLSIKQLSKRVEEASVEALLAMPPIPALINAKVEALVRLIDTDPALFLPLYRKVVDDVPVAGEDVLARILAERIDYLFLKVQDDDLAIRKLVAFLVKTGFYADLIAYLNRVGRTNAAKKVLNVIKEMAPDDVEFMKQLNWYLHKDLYALLGFPTVQFPRPPKPKGKIEAHKTRWLLGILAIAILFFPIVFLATTSFTIFQTSLLQVLTRYIVIVNASFIAYFWFLNIVYIVMAIAAAFGAKRQIRLWEIKSADMLNQKGMLSSISIVAPAYNESKSIVESVTSLLHLNYPDFEVIVVNDGSKDNTLQVLIDHFELQRKNIFVEQHLGTRPVLGVYVNRSIPNLVVIDKLNGGKADALNVGINAAKNDYVCGIDADSLLAPDSLLRLMSSMLDNDDITLAIGGNIAAVNGCVVEHGVVEKLGMAKSQLAQFQTVEYLRAFTLGRIAFADWKSLVIVSGAFGLFEKQMLIEVGGYLTASTFQKDTVGEDMELAVRISRKASERKLNYRIGFVYHAKCYTEVPEQSKIFFKQRNRWQRGLIDILSYHRHMIFNAKYKQVGMIAMPYFFLFEMLGPLLELQGYAAIILGLLFGILSPEIVLMLLIVNVLVGMVLSLFALLVEEHDIPYLPKRDTFKLIWTAIIESLGWRQIIGIHRAISFFSALKENQEWGSMTRVGFQAKQTQPAATPPQR